VKCQFAIDDGAYVLGALSPADRAAFERHLPSCSQCRKAVASFAVIPGLLGRLNATTPTSSAATPSTLLARTLAAASAQRRIERRRRTWYALGAGLAAAVLASVVGVGVHLVDTSGGSLRPEGLTSMEPVKQRAPVSAELGLIATDNGSRINMQCRYESGYDGVWTLRLVVYPRSGGEGEQVGTWTARSGQEVSLSAMTHLAPAEIGRVELHREDGSPILTWAPP